MEDMKPDSKTSESTRFKKFLNGLSKDDIRKMNIRIVPSDKSIFLDDSDGFITINTIDKDDVDPLLLTITGVSKETLIEIVDILNKQ